MKIKYVSPLDAAFMMVERDDMPWHIANLMLFTKPSGAAPDFVPALREQMRGQSVVAPYDQAPAFPSARWFPLQRRVEAIDFDHHVRLHTLPDGADDQDLLALVSEIHAEGLDPRHPSWEMHLIDGISGSRFGIFMKLHHSILDGVTGMRQMLRWLTTDPTDLSRPALFSVGPDPLAPPREVLTLGERVRRRSIAVAELSRNVSQLVRKEFDGQRLAAPYGVPKTVWSGPVSRGRSISYRSFELDELKTVARAHGVGVSDLVLYMCGSALRTYLLAHGDVPARSLTAGAPFNIRAEGDERPGSSFAFLTVDLGTDIADARERLARVKASNDASKAQVATLGPEALALQTVVANGPMIATMAMGMRGRTLPAFGVVVSNVPGPPELLYLNGARLDAMIPISIPMHNSPFNMTCIGYDGKMTFGVAAASEQIVDVDLITDGLASALNELRGAESSVTRGADGSAKP
ncbi:wax ester/triacylglycerol synthase family O-acyltransferase [Nocardioides sp. WG-D5]